jgi:hypothetical protein
MTLVINTKDVKDKEDLLALFNKIINKWKTCYPRIFNVIVEPDDPKVEIYIDPTDAIKTIKMLTQLGYEVDE